MITYNCDKCGTQIYRHENANNISTLDIKVHTGSILSVENIDYIYCEKCIDKIIDYLNKQKEKLTKK